MFSEKNIIVTIGNYGAVVALHEGNELKNKIFLDELNDTTKADLLKIFANNKLAPVYVLLDTIDQSYKKKVYPSVHKGDLMRLIKRDLDNDVDKESLKNCIILNKNTRGIKAVQAGSKRWECLFVSSSNSEIVNNWIEFLLSLPNFLVGIYMLPVETFSLFSLLKKNIKGQSKVKNKRNDLYCVIVQNKVSGIRQIVFSEQGIVFTRIVNYNFDQPDFLEKYEHDIYSTFEYLKRLFPDLALAELDIINIFPPEVLKLIKNSNNIELHFINYTPAGAAAEIGYPNLLQQNSQFCDLLISKVFSKGKKILKFTTPKIKTLDRFFGALKASYYLNLFLLVVIAISVVFMIFSQKSIGELIEIAETEKFSAFQEFSKLKKLALQDSQITEAEENIDTEKVVDFGKMEELLGNVGADVSDLYFKLQFLKSSNVKLNRFSYTLAGFNSKAPIASKNYQFGFAGVLQNKSGNIEDLFKQFDSLNNEVKKAFDKAQIKHSDLPKDLDFNQKYYESEIDFSLNNNQ